MEKKVYLTKRQKKIAITIGTIIAVYLGFKYLLPLFVPFLIAYFIAWIIRPVVGFLHRKFKIPLVVGGTVGVVVLFGAIVTLLFFIGRALCNQLILLLKNLPVYEQYIDEQLDGMCKTSDTIFGLKYGSVRTVVEDGINSMVAYVQDDLIPRVTEETIRIVFAIFGVFAIVLIVLVAAVLIIKDMEEYKAGLRKSEFYPAVHKITQKLSDTGIAYMKTQAIIMTIIAAIVSIGFFIIKNPYALLIGIFVGVFDAFPVLGSGLILIPWSIIMVLQKDFLSAAVIMTTFVICQIVREVLEPRLLGNRIGIKPIYDMMAMYIGLQLFGVIGFFLGPLGLVVIKTVLKTYVKDD